MAKQPPYYYTHRLSWTGDKRGQLAADQLPEITVAPPPEFAGPPGCWSPEQLFVASANACVMATFLAIAANSQLSFDAYSSSATGKLEKVGAGGLQISEIVIRVRLSLQQAKDREKARRVLVKAEENCLISRSMKSRVIVEAEIVVGS
jgi:organic hydroperoxide reductase OsmC/OhrA